MNDSTDCALEGNSGRITNGRVSMKLFIYLYALEYQAYFRKSANIVFPCHKQILPMVLKSDIELVLEKLWSFYKVQRKTFFSISFK